MATTMLDVIQREGMKKWKAEGRAEGRAEAWPEAQINSVIKVLESRFGELPATLRNKLLKVQSEERIETLLGIVGTCQSLKEFQKSL